MLMRKNSSSDISTPCKHRESQDIHLTKRGRIIGSGSISMVLRYSVAGSMDQTNDRGNAWMTEMVKRNVAAIEDLNCLELLVISQLISICVYRLLIFPYLSNKRSEMSQVFRGD